MYVCDDNCNTNHGKPIGAFLTLSTPGKIFNRQLIEIFFLFSLENRF